MCFNPHIGTTGHASYRRDHAVTSRCWGFVIEYQLGQAPAPFYQKETSHV